MAGPAGATRGPAARLARGIGLELAKKRAVGRALCLGLALFSNRMRIIVAAIGRCKQGPERELAASYRKRAEATGRPLGLRNLEIIEIRESRAQDAERRRAEESIALANVVPEDAIAVVLDRGGENLDSRKLAALLREWRAEGRPAVCFIIGGADGLAPSLYERAKVRLAFGAATWPHQLVRIMLLEQLYRAGTILAGHPYHRA